MSERGYVTELWLSRGISRGRDTYGYNILRLEDAKTGRRYRCMGGGYDMTGTVLADWLSENYGTRLARWHARQEEGSYKTYGVYVRGGVARMDGSVGVECVLRVMKGLGLTWERHYNRKGDTTGWKIYDTAED